MGRSLEHRRLKNSFYAKKNRSRKNTKKALSESYHSAALIQSLVLQNVLQQLEKKTLDPDKANSLRREREELEASMPFSQQGEVTCVDLKAVANNTVNEWSCCLDVDAHIQCPAPEAKTEEVKANSPEPCFVSNSVQLDSEPFDLELINFLADSDIINWVDESTDSPSLPTCSGR